MSTRLASWQLGTHLLSPARLTIRRHRVSYSAVYSNSSLNASDDTIVEPTPTGTAKLESLDSVLGGLEALAEKACTLVASRTQLFTAALERARADVAARDAAIRAKDARIAELEARLAAAHAAGGASAEEPAPEADAPPPPPPPAPTPPPPMTTYAPIKVCKRGNDDDTKAAGGPQDDMMKQLQKKLQERGEGGSVDIEAALAERKEGDASKDDMMKQLKIRLQERGSGAPVDIEAAIAARRREAASGGAAGAALRRFKSRARPAAATQEEKENEGFAFP